MSIFHRNGHAARLIELDACPGYQEVEDTPQPRLTSCRAHFDAWANPWRHCREIGEAYTPLPTSVLSWVRSRAGSSCFASWNASDAACTAESEVSIRALRNDAMSCTEAGAPLSVGVVIFDREPDLGHFAAPFDFPDDAYSFRRDQTDWYESDCACTDRDRR